MKEKFLYLIIGLLIGAMLTTGVFMIIDKNKSEEAPNNGQIRNGTGPVRIGEPLTQEQLDAMEKTIMEDGAVRYQSPDGGVMMQKRIEP